MVSAHMQTSQRRWRKFLTTIRLGAVGSQTLGETTLQCKLHTIRPHVRFVKRAQMKTELGLVLKYITGGTEKLNK